MHYNNYSNNTTTKKYIIYTRPNNTSQPPQITPAHQLHLAFTHRVQGMMTSACRRLGATNESKAGLTNFWYCSNTPPTSLPRMATSRCILCMGDDRAHAGVDRAHAGVCYT